MVESISIDYETKALNHINILNQSRVSIQNTLDSDSNIINKIILLDEAYSFFSDMYKYFDRMNLTNEVIENIILKLDDLMEEFEEFENMKSENSFLNEYFKKADEFYTLLVNLQFEMSGFLSDKKYNKTNRWC